MFYIYQVSYKGFAYTSFASQAEAEAEAAKQGDGYEVTRKAVGVSRWQGQREYDKAFN